MRGIGLNKDQLITGALLGIIIVLFSTNILLFTRMQTLEKSRTTAISRIAHMYSDVSLNYLFQEVKVNPTAQNIEALALELRYRKKVIEAMILLYENDINKPTWQEFKSLAYDFRISRYLFDAAHTNKINEVDIETIERIESSWVRFHEQNDRLQLYGITDPTHFTYSYIKLIQALSDIVDFDG